MRECEHNIIQYKYVKLQYTNSNGWIHEERVGRGVGRRSNFVDTTATALAVTSLLRVLCALSFSSTPELFFVQEVDCQYQGYILILIEQLCLCAILSVCCRGDTCLGTQSVAMTTRRATKLVVL